MEEKKLLSFVEKAGLLSAAEKAGVSLSKVESLKLLSTAENLGLLSLAESAASTDGAVIASLGLPFFALGCGASQTHLTRCISLIPPPPSCPPVTDPPAPLLLLLSRHRRAAVHPGPEPVPDGEPGRAGSHPVWRRLRPADCWQPGERTQRVGVAQMTRIAAGMTHAPHWSAPPHSRCASMAALVVTAPPWSRVRGRASSRRTVCCCAQETEHRSSRRLATLLAAAAPAVVLLSAQQPATAAVSGDWSSPGLARPGPGAEYVRTPSGVVYEVLASGTGAAAAVGDLVQFDYTLRRGNGYFIYSTADCGIGCGDGSPFFATLGKTALITGLEELLTGMRPGERRRALIPPALGYVRCGWAGRDS